MILSQRGRSSSSSTGYAYHSCYCSRFIKRANWIGCLLGPSKKQIVLADTFRFEGRVYAENKNYDQNKMESLYISLPNLLNHGICQFLPTFYAVITANLEYLR